MKKYKLLLLLLLFHCHHANAQQADSLPVEHTIGFYTGKFHSRNTLPAKEANNSMKPLIVPGLFIAYGLISIDNDHLQALDNEIKEEIWTDHPHHPVTIDNYLQYVPAATVYTLNAMGIKGTHNFRDRTIIYLISNTIMGVTVQSMKSITKVQRPDGFGTNAFPSGHTATAFVSAEFLRQEYKDVSPWYGILGYAAATATAYLRMYNNRHWFRDLLPGAGIGILSTRVAYWMYPAIKRKFFQNNPLHTVVMPYYHNRVGGISLVHHFEKN